MMPPIHYTLTMVLSNWNCLFFRLIMTERVRCPHAQPHYIRMVMRRRRCCRCLSCVAHMLLHQCHCFTWLFRSKASCLFQICERSQRKVCCCIRLSVCHYFRELFFLFCSFSIYLSVFIFAFHSLTHSLLYRLWCYYFECLHLIN